MAKFGYTTIKNMPKRDGNSFATSYYKQNSTERQRTQQHVESVYQQLNELLVESTDNQQVITQPLPEFKRTGDQANYSAADIIIDMHDQLASGKDIPSGILGRWNRLFNQYAPENAHQNTIELEKGYTHNPGADRFRGLFE